MFGREQRQFLFDLRLVRSGQKVKHVVFEKCYTLCEIISFSFVCLHSSKSGPEIDKDYIARWSERLSLMDIWNLILNEISKKNNSFFENIPGMAPDGNIDEIHGFALFLLLVNPCARQSGCNIHYQGCKTVNHQHFGWEQT
jgi:hypothetical protein